MNETGGDTDLSAHSAAIVRDEDDERERLHPLTLFTGLGAALRGAWGALLASVYFISQGRAWIAGVMIAAVVIGSLVTILMRYLSFSYRVEPDEIDMASGILSRNQRSIPFDRIQDVNIEQGILHRMVGLAKVKFETGASAGSKQDDGSLDSVTLERANALRDLIRAHRAGAVADALPGAEPAHPAQEEERPVIFAMDAKRLILLSLFSFSLAIVGALFGIAQTYGDALGLDLFDPDFWGGMLAQAGPLQDYVLANRFVTILFGIVSLSLAGVLTGFIRVIPREWRFKLRRTETGFRRQRGLFTLTDVVIPLRRVQAAILGTGPIRRRNGYYELKVQSLGHDSGQGGDHGVAPLATLEEAETIIGEMGWRALPDTTAGWQRPSRAFVTGFLIGMIPVVAIIALGITSIATAIRADDGLAAADIPAFATPIYLASFVGLYALGALLRLLDFRHRRHLVDGDRFLMRSGWWRQRLVILPLGKIQSADLYRSFVDRWFGIADLKLGVAGGSGFSAHGVDALPKDIAYGLRERLLKVAA